MLRPGRGKITANSATLPTPDGALPLLSQLTFAVKQNSILILAASIAALFTGNPFASIVPTAPRLAYGVGGDTGELLGGNDLNPADAYDFAQADLNRIVGNVSRALARKTPFTDILAGGTIAANVSTVQRAIVQEEAYDNDSLARPTFQVDIQTCGKVGEDIEVGSKEFSFQLGTNRGRGPLVCIKTMRDAFEGVYLAAEDSIRKKVVQRVNSDIRATLTDRSGGKLIVRAGATFSQMYDGDTNAIDTLFPTTWLPDAPLNFKLLDYTGQHMRENLLVDGFEGSDSEPLLKFIGSQEIINYLRDDANIRTDHRYLTAGSYAVGKDSLLRYRWEGPYRGFAFGVDPMPLRFSTVDENGQPDFIEPLIRINSTKGKASRINPLWIRARFEVGLLCGADSFARLTPPQYTGEGSFRFPSQVSMGELKFKVIEDNGDNVWGDWGRHYFQIQRAYKPLRPHAITAIAFKRAGNDFGLTAVDDYQGYSSNASI